MDVYKLRYFSFSKQISDNFHHLPVTSVGAGLREDAVSGCVYTGGACHAAGFKRSESSGRLKLHTLCI